MSEFLDFPKHYMKSCEHNYIGPAKDVEKGSFTTNGSSKQAIDISVSKVVAQLSCCTLISKDKQNISPMNHRLLFC